MGGQPAQNAGPQAWFLLNDGSDHLPRLRLLSVPHFAAQAPAVCKLSGLLERTKIKVLGALGLKKLSFYKVFGRLWTQKGKLLIRIYRLPFTVRGTRGTKQQESMLLSVSVKAPFRHTFCSIYSRLLSAI